MSQKLDVATTKLGKHYKEWKSAEKAKNDAKDEFFKEVSDAVEVDEKLVVTGPEGRGMTQEDATALLERRNPGWVVDDIRVSDDGWEAIMVEDPALKGYTFVNRNDGMVYQRQIVTGSPMLDDEALKVENPELWSEVSEVPYEAWIKNVMYHCGVDGHDVDDDFEEYLRILPGAPERTLKPLTSLEPETLAALHPYIYYGEPTIKLAAPRKATPEELQ